MTFQELQQRKWVFPEEGSSSAPYLRYEKGLLRQDGKPGFNTPSGKMEIYSTLREDWDLEPMAHYEEPPFTPVTQPDKLEKYPLILSTGRRSAVFFHSEHRNIPWLRALDPDPVVEIHPDTAAERAMTSRVSSPGLMSFKATLRRRGFPCSAAQTSPIPPSPTFSRRR